MAVVGGGEEERAGTRDEEEDWTGGEEAVGDTAGEVVAEAGVESCWAAR